MNIIPHFLEKETKNLLKSKLSQIISNTTDELISNIFSYNPDIKYQNLILQLDESVKQSIINIFKETFTIFDYISSQKNFTLSKKEVNFYLLLIIFLLQR